MWHRGVRDVWLEGGPTVAAAFLRAGLVDDIYAYVAPALLGGGRPAVADLGIESITGVRRLDLEDVTVVGDDVRIHAAPRADTRQQPAVSGATDLLEQAAPAAEAPCARTQ